MAKSSYHHGDLRRALVDAALALIQEGELGTLSLREVARRAGVTPAAPYHHFRDKVELLAAVAEEGFIALGERMDLAVSAMPPRKARARVAALARAYLEFARERQAHYRVMFLPEVKVTDPALGVHVAADAALARLVAAVHAAAPKADADTVHRRAVIAWGAGHGIVSLWNDGVLEKKLSVVDDDFVEMVVDQMVSIATGKS
ncbi:TetR/AcrR family transcriptional regulator [Pendulispora rubella]|uniref:TetR/AcrR family transcriptional regulator n=1 Tax=Pendulispora rubella TaxID=2741070 RepID=UPI00374E056F